MVRITTEDAIAMGLEQPKKKKHKYNCSPPEDRTWEGWYHGRNHEILFDSKKEMHRFKELVILLLNGEIEHLTRQERFLVNYDPVTNEKTYYVADFYYFDLNTGKWTAEDVKGRITQVYKRKKRQFIKRYPNIIFKEVLV